MNMDYLCTSVDCLDAGLPAFATLSQYTQHVVEVHTSGVGMPPLPPSGCAVCGEGVCTGEQLVSHLIDWHHGDDGGLEDLAAGASTSATYPCPICADVFYSQAEIEVHTVEHFDDSFCDKDHALAIRLEVEENERAKRDEAAEFRKLQDKYGMSEDGLGYKQQMARSLDTALDRGKITVDQYQDNARMLVINHGGGCEEAGYATRGLLPIILTLSQASRDVHETRICRPPSVEHLSTSRGDSGWGCGYRNCQMLISALIIQPQFAHLKANTDNIPGGSHMPSVPALQRMIEAAWGAGFDHVGAASFNRSLQNTKKWIGATDVAAYLSSKRVRTEMYDFKEPTGPNGSHPRLFHCLFEYFSAPRTGQTDFIPPVICQHQGHSITIVGIERLSQPAGEYRLLVFDPGLYRFKAQAYLAGSKKPWEMRPFRKRLVDLKKPQYQLLFVRGVMDDEAEFEASKNHINVRKIT